MNNFIKYNWFKIITTLAILIVALSIGYYFLFFLPDREKLKTEQNQKEVAVKMGSATILKTNY